VLAGSFCWVQPTAHNYVDPHVQEVSMKASCAQVEGGVTCTQKDMWLPGVEEKDDGP